MTVGILDILIIIIFSANMVACLFAERVILKENGIVAWILALGWFLAYLQK